MEWFRENMWQTWAAVAFLLGVAELFSLDLVLLMLASGAVVGVLAAMLGLPFAIQALAALATSVAMLTLVRPSFVKRMHGGPDLVQGHDKLVGKTGTVVEEITADGGQVRIAGEVWSARPYDDDAVIEVGARVDVFQIRGATAVVHKIPEIE